MTKLEMIHELLEDLEKCTNYSDINSLEKRVEVLFGDKYKSATYAKESSFITDKYNESKLISDKKIIKTFLNSTVDSKKVALVDKCNELIDEGLKCQNNRDAAIFLRKVLSASIGIKINSDVEKTILGPKDAVLIMSIDTLSILKGVVEQLRLISKSAAEDSVNIR